MHLYVCVRPNDTRFELDSLPHASSTSRIDNAFRTYSPPFCVRRGYINMFI